jgi:hypothetical protein
MKAGRLMVIGAAALIVVAGATAAAAAVAVAASPIRSGVIHGCWATKAVHGSHVIKLQNAGTRCPKGTTAISWSQKGPAGPDGRDRRDGSAGSRRTARNGRCRRTARTSGAGLRLHDCLGHRWAGAVSRHVLHRGEGCYPRQRQRSPAARKLRSVHLLH